MPQSLAQIYLHLVFSTKDRQPLLAAEIQPRLHAYLAGTLNAISCPAIQVGGMPDHVHLLLRLSSTIPVADVVKAAKIESSKWMKENANQPQFAWQAGYGVFSVSASQVESVTQYITNQAEHHRTRTFQDEFRKFLENHQLEYDEAYVWD